MTLSPRPVWLAVAVAALAAAGCSGPARETARPGPEPRRIAALADSLGRTADRPSFVARRLRAAGVTPLAAGSFRVAEGVVGGFVPGRQPLGRPSLLVVGASAQSGSLPVVLEAARVLVARSRWEVVPERTVLVAVWDGPDASAGLRRILRAGLWPADAVAGILVVDAPAPALAVPTDRVAGGADAAAAARLADQIVAAARYVPTPDTLATP